MYFNRGKILKILVIQIAEDGTLPINVLLISAISTQNSQNLLQNQLQDPE